MSKNKLRYHNMAKGEFAQKAAKSASLKVASTFAAPEETGTRHFKKPEALAKDELLVQWSAEATTAIRAQIHKQLETEVVETLHTKAMKTSDTGVLEVVINKKSSRSLSQLQKEFSNEATVIFAEPNQTISIQAISNDPKINNLWGMQGSYGSKATTAWDQNYIGSSKIVTGIIDSGIDYTHQDLYLNIWLNQGEIRSLSFFSFLQDIDKDGLITFRDLNSSINLTNPSANLKDWNTNGYIDAGDLLNNQSGWEDGKDNDINGYIDDLIGWDFVNKDNDPYDDNSHGTHVAGTIGAIGNNNTGVSGLNWQTQMIALKTLSGAGSGSLSSAVAATDYFTTAKVQATNRNESSRFIGTNNSWGGGGYSQALADSIKRASDQNLLFIAAAGNGGSDGISDNNDIYQNYPSNYTNSNVIAVASLTSTGALSSFSNYGAVSVDLGAPGSSILSTLPGNQYGTYSGTSMATPHVTGALALMASANLQATAQQLKDALLQSAVATTSLSGKTLSGGRLDVAAAISKLNGVPPTATPTYTLTPSSSSINEGAVLTSTVATTNLVTGSKLYYALSGTGITIADFSAGSLTGEGAIDSTGKFTFSHTIENDLLTEGTEALSIKLYSDSARTLQVGSTATVSIADTSKTSTTPTYTLTPSASSINEGAVLTSTVTTTNLATGSKLYYALSGTGITIADFSAGTLTGEGATDSTGKFTFSHTIKNDLLTENTETLSIKLYSDSVRTLQVGSTATVSIADTSKASTPLNLVLWGSTSNDKILGGNGNDIITGAVKTGATAVSLGKGQIDTLTGGAGKDVFVLGDSRGVFYNDNLNANSGSSDYALITDFSLIDDKLQLLSGSYLTTVSGGNLSLYWDRNKNGSLNLSGNNQDEMIAKLSNVTSLSNTNINWI
ncbi:S8 family serine peptidase [Synechococcus sp. UW140]|uniref:S8 family serine peptidase n=1 Tax=Synechococcus sp. UW140 TaxID=368503 RepID=UPI0025E6E0F4|nr:S8 family serine peptidase [Synechococcus sp. UW140]